MRDGDSVEIELDGRDMTVTCEGSAYGDCAIAHVRWITVKLPNGKIKQIVIRDEDLEIITPEPL